ncbi:MAG TPA: AMP-binding protein, partial [Holophaga sp.]|nr:AMP-binding protein [Holophaga sp.]
TVHILRPEQSADGAFFARYILDQGITTAYLNPAVLEEVAAHLAPEVGRLKLRCLITGLHAKKERTLQAFRDLAPDLRILNAYGPTETTYGATAFAFTTTDDPERDAPIGVPFPGYQTYIVDARMRPVPIGVAGELLIGGLGVARGYLDQPELTDRAFVPDPWGPVPGGRLYRTGDRCRYRADGVIEFLGRTDHQVKLRGYRVELGEIEGALGWHPAVRECVVIAVPDAFGGLRLAAYVAGEGLPVAGELKAFLRTSLPEYMVPSVVIPLQALPRTTAGKVDRRALPAPDPAQADPGRSFEPPRTPAEAFLAGIWREVLHLETVGIHDPFFELGGQSLLAVRVIARIRKERGVEVSLRRFFDRPTIAALAPLLEASVPSAAVPGLKVLPRLPA